MGKIILFLLLMTTPAYAGYTAADTADDVLVADNVVYETETFTGMAWFKTNGSQANYTNALMVDNADDVAWEIAFDLAFGTGGGLRPYFFTQTDGDDGLCEASSTITDATWTHLAIKHTGSELEGFIDGSSACTDATTGTVNYDTSPPTFTESFIGDIDQVCIWNVALLDAEILHISNAKIRGIELQIQPSALVDCWYLDDHAEGTAVSGSTFKSMTSARVATAEGGASIVAVTGQLTYP